MRVMRVLKSLSPFVPPLVLAVFVLAGITFLPTPEGIGQTVDLVRFRVVQVIDEPVIDLEDSVPEDVPRYNTIALADLNGGGVDLVAVNEDSGGVNVYLNQGSGTFDEPIEIEAGDVVFPVAVVLEDFAGPFDQNSGAPDGNRDILVFDEDGTVALLLGDGAGGFSLDDQEVEFVSGLADAISGAVSADFDGDGTPDVALADFDEIIFICNDGGTLRNCPQESVFIEGATFTDIGTGDFDGDGDADIVVIDPLKGNAHPIYGDNAGNFTVDAFPQPLYAGLGQADEARFAVVNFDNAGADDLLAVSNDNFDSNNARTFVGLGGARYRLAAFSAPFVPNGVAGADFSGDGVPDVVVSEDRLYFIPGTENGDLSGFSAVDASERGGAMNRLMARAEVLKSADLDGDGLLDLVGLVSDGQEVEVALNVRDEPTPTGGPTSPTTPGGGETPTPTPTGPTPTRTPPPPTATATPRPTVGLGRCDYNLSNVADPNAARGVVVADLNGGGADIAVSDGSRVHIVYNTGNADLRACAQAQRAGNPPIDPPSSVMSEVVSGAADLAVLDANGDGDLEIAVARPGMVSFMEINNQGVPVPIAALQTAVPGNPVQIVTDYAAHPFGANQRDELDVDGDGASDVLVANDANNSISILYGNGGSEPFTVVSHPINTRSRTISAGDVSGDGRVDIVVGTDTGVLYLVQGNPSGGRPTFSLRGTVNLRQPVMALQTGFFNNDALADVFLADGTPTARVLVTQGNLNDPTNFVAFPLFVPASAAATLFFDPLESALDVVVSLPATNQLVFGLGNREGGMRQLLAPLSTGPMPRDLWPADVDLDTQMDVVTANGDGTVSILISSEPPPTPTPTITATPTIETPGTATPTGSVEPTPTPTSPTPTPATPSMTPTVPKPGTFQLSGGCAVSDQPSPAMAWVLLIGAVAVWGARRRALGSPQRITLTRSNP